MRRSAKNKSFNHFTLLCTNVVRLMNDLAAMVSRMEIFDHEIAFVVQPEALLGT